MFKHLFLAGTILLTTTGHAYEQHLTLERDALQVLQTKPKALTLDEVKKIVSDEEIDIQISYERLIQAQRKIGQARAAFFPYGVGTIGAMYLVNVWNPILLAELITSLPSKVFAVQSEKNMSLAQKYSLAALRENIKNQVSHMYYNILQEEVALKLTKMEIALRETQVHTYKQRVKLGLATEEDVKDLEYALVKVRDAYLKFSSYMNAEKAAFNVMLGKTPQEGKTIELQPVATLLSGEDYQMDLNAMITEALDKSNEIVAADYMVRAASKAKRSTKWSILSFSGIGFGYYARVQVAGSKVQEAVLNRKFVEENLVNQVYIVDNAFQRSLDLLQSERDVFADTDFYTRSQMEKFKAGALSVDKLIETQLVYLKDFNEMVRSHYNSLIKLSDVERVLVGKVVTTPVEESTFEVSMDKSSRNWHRISIKSSGDDKIEKVYYQFDKYLGLRPMTSYASENEFPVRLKLYDPDFVAGTAEINLESGEVIKKQFKFQ